MKKIIINSLLFVLLAHILPGVTITGLWSAFFAAVIYACLRATVGFVLKVITFPLYLLTFGITSILINGLILQLTAAVVGGFWISGFWSALAMAVLLSVLQSILIGDNFESRHYSY